MPEFPEKPTETKSTKGDYTLFEGVKRVHQLNTNVLLANGWTRIGRIYLKGDLSLEFLGDSWVLNGIKKVKFLEDLPTDLNDKK